MSPAELAQRIAALDWSGTSTEHQLAVSAAVETLKGLEPMNAQQPVTIYTNVVALHRPKTMRHVTLLHLDGHPWHTAGFLPGDAGAPWAWIVETVSREHECSEEAVGCAEPDEDEGGGDFVTIDGERAYRVKIGPYPITR